MLFKPDKEAVHGCSENRIFTRQTTIKKGRTDAKALLGIPQERLVRTAISLGYPDEEARRARPKVARARKPLSEIVHFERYSSVV